MAKRKRSRERATPAPASPVAGSLAASRRWGWLLAPGIVLLLLLLLYREPLLQGLVFASSDTSAAEAFRQVGDAARRQGTYPLWNPYIFGGMPSFGSLAYVYGVYPPTLVFEWLQHLGFHPLTWLFGHLLLGGLGMWWLLGRWSVPWPARCLGVVIWLWSARLVAWAVHGHGTKLGAEMYLPWLVGLTWTILGRGGLRPTAVAALVLGLQLLRGHIQVTYYTLLLIGFVTVWHLIRPFATAPAALGGQTEPARELPRAMASEPGAARRGYAGLLLLVLILGFAIGAVLLLPVHSYASFSTRGAGGATGAGGAAYDYATAWSLAPEDLGAVFMPTAAGFGQATYMGRMPFTTNPNYVGLLVPLLAAAAWLARRQRNLVWACAAAAVLALLLALGRYSPGLYQLAYNVLPYFDKFRAPSMIMVLPVLLLSILAPLGAAALADPREDRARWLRRAAIFLFGVGGLMLLSGITGFGESFYQSHLTDLADKSQRPAAPVLLAAAWDLHRDFLLRIGLLLLAAGGAALLAARRPAFRRTWLVPVLAALVAIDLWGVARLVTNPEQRLQTVVRTADGGGRLVPAERLLQRWPGPARSQVAPDLAAHLQRTVGHDRLLPLGADRETNAYMTAGIRSLGGYYPAKPAVGEAVRERLYPRAGLFALRIARWLGAAAITYPGGLIAADLDVLREHGLALVDDPVEAGGTVVYRVEDPLPRARLVERYRLATALPEGDALEPFLDAIAAGRHDPTGLLILDREPAPAPLTGPEPLPAPVFVEDGLNRVVVNVAAPRPVLLLLADIWAPGWRATVDGRSAPLLRADLMLRAVALPAGAHEVSFEYHDPALRRGIALAATGVLIVLILLAWPWVRRSLSRTAPALSATSESDRDADAS